MNMMSSPLGSSVGRDYGSPPGSGGGGAEQKMFLSHGGRPTKGNGRKRKGVDEYAAENRVDFTSRSIIRDGQLVRILVCRFCCQSIGARSDRIKEHLASKRHQKLKLEAFKEAAEAGRDLTQEYSDDSVSALLPEPPITMLKFPGKALAHLLEGEGVGRHSSRELSPDGDDRREPIDRKVVIPTPPPLQDHGLHSPPPQSVHPVAMHSGLGVRGNVAPPQQQHGNTNTPPPVPKTESVPQQLLCVRWGNYDSNIVSMFSKLRSQEHFVDVTLWCEDRTIKCHKMVLSACSTYFEHLLTENPNNNPIIFLKDMRYWEIEALVEFMYKGETSIHQDKLQSLLRAAESLQIKGLGSPSNNNTAGNNNNNQQNCRNEQRHQPPQHHSSPLTRDLSGGVQGSHHGASSNEEDLSNSMDMSVNNLSMSNHHPHSGLASSLLANSHQNMGMDLSNHSSHNHLGNLHGLGGHQPHPAKRRKKETPRRIDTLPRVNHPHTAHSAQLLPLFAGVTAMRVEDEDGLSDDEDSMIIQERNHNDTVKTEHSASDQNYDDSNDADQEHFNDGDQGQNSMDEDEDSNGPTADMDDEELSAGIAGSMGLGGLTDLRIGLSNSIGGMNLVSSERDGERERSRKGNPIKKIHFGIGNNNNNNDSGPPPALIHHTAID